MTGEENCRDTFPGLDYKFSQGDEASVFLVPTDANRRGGCSYGEQMFFLRKDGSLEIHSRTNRGVTTQQCTSKPLHSSLAIIGDVDISTIPCIPMCVYHHHLFLLVPQLHTDPNVSVGSESNYCLMYLDLHDPTATVEVFDTPFPFHSSNICTLIAVHHGTIYGHYPAESCLKAIQLSDCFEECTGNVAVNRQVDCANLSSSTGLFCLHSPADVSQGLWLIGPGGIGVLQSNGILSVVVDVPEPLPSVIRGASTGGHSYLIDIPRRIELGTSAGIGQVVYHIESDGKLIVQGAKNLTSPPNHNYIALLTVSEMKLREESLECAICFDELANTYLSPEVIALDCGHRFHAACMDQCLSAADGFRTSGKNIVFNLIKCCLCSMFVRHPKLPVAVTFTKIRTAMYLDAYRRYVANAGHAYFSGDDVKGVMVTKKPSEVIDDLKMYYYLCKRCERPYFGGSHSCAEGLSQVNINPAVLLCASCETELHCGHHKEEGLLYQCTYCCNPAPHHMRFGRFHVCEVCVVNKNTNVQRCEGPSKCPFGGSESTCGIRRTLNSGPATNQAKHAVCIMCPNTSNGILVALDLDKMTYPTR